MFLNVIVPPSRTVLAPNDATAFPLAFTTKLFSLITTLSLLLVVFLIVTVPPSMTVFAPNDATALLLSKTSNESSLIQLYHCCLWRF